MRIEIKEEFWKTFLGQQKSSSGTSISVYGISLLCTQQQTFFFGIFGLKISHPFKICSLWLAQRTLVCWLASRQICMSLSKRSTTLAASTRSGGEQHDGGLRPVHRTSVGSASKGKGGRGTSTKK
jgi:hypothetical protein